MVPVPPVGHLQAPATTKGCWVGVSAAPCAKQQTGTCHVELLTCESERLPHFLRRTRSGLTHGR
jgi:hypothetical protein